MNELDFLLDERYDYSIMNSLMYTNFDGVIVDSGKSGDTRIYKTLKWMEKNKGIKL